MALNPKPYNESTQFFIASKELILATPGEGFVH
jgi:hypothetical protein